MPRDASAGIAADTAGEGRVVGSRLSALTRGWGEMSAVSLYLDRCQVATPERLVKATWRHINEARDHVGKVVDFGAGDGRFASGGLFEEYVGYEIDDLVCSAAKLPPGARLINQCAFSEPLDDADVAIGNPPFVRNQDLPAGWRQQAATAVKDRTGLELSGLANAWQYFFILSLASAKPDGLCAVVIPYEWVSRPSSLKLREYIREQGWRVTVYRLVDAAFSSVMTTASITLVDKRERDGVWSYLEESSDGSFRRLASPTGTEHGVLPYRRRRREHSEIPYAKRGLSPGTQKVLTLSEGERVRAGLQADRDVVPSINSLRHLPNEVSVFDEVTWRRYYRDVGQKCWLIRTDYAPSQALARYLDGVPASAYQTQTCLSRKDWWRFLIPDVPDVLIAMSFRSAFPKAVFNELGGRAVGGVYGVYGVTPEQARHLTTGLGGMDLSARVVAHSHGLHKIEIGQLNALLANAFGEQHESDASDS